MNPVSHDGSSGTSGPCRAYPLKQNLVTLFEAQAALTPAAIAVTTGDADFTYAALYERVGVLSRAFAARGVESEQPVGVLMRRSPDLIALLLAVLKIGAAYVPLDPDDPPERNRRILDGSGCRLVFGDHASHDKLVCNIATASDRREFQFVAIADISASSPSAPVATAEGGDRLAYILFTSGSTGAPKGVEVEHRNVINLLCAARDLLEFTAQDRFLAASTIGFDISVAELFLPLITGGSLLLRDRNSWLNPRLLAEEVRRHGVTVIQTGPSVWAVILAEVPDFPRVRIAITTAEPIAPGLARRLLAYGEKVWNLYGPTETTVWATAHRVNAETTDAIGSAFSASIGRPMANCTALILGAGDLVVKDGEAGELCIGGLGLARGYRNNPELTRERFITWGESAERFYRTGDLVRWDHEGELSYLGRNDDQLKIRGVRIEPREVEAALLTHPDVVHAAATWFENGSGARSIVAALVTRAAVRPAVATLHHWLQTRLPPQMVPARFIFCDTLPLTPSGKVDRAAIRRTAVPNAVAAVGTAMPLRERLSSTESSVAEVWRRILKVDSVGPEDHFFSIGGDSLAAVRMVTEVESIFKISVPVQTTFEAPTLARFAAKVDRTLARLSDGPQANFLFPLVEHTGTPLFFSNVDLKLASRGLWRVPCPLYSVSQWAQGDGFVKAKTLRDLARVQIAAIRQIQPSGPYRIAGYSFGGLLAFELATQLQAAGLTVDLLFLLDPMQPFRTIDAPNGYPMEGLVTPVAETFGGRVARHTRNLYRRPGGIGSYIAEKLWWHARNNAARQWLIYQLVHLQGRHYNAISRRLLPKNRWPAFWYNARRMTKDYVARPYTGRVLAVFPDRGERFQLWQTLFPSGAEICIAGGDHGTFFDEPAMSIWMKALSHRIAGGETSTCVLT